VTEAGRPTGIARGDSMIVVNLAIWGHHTHFRLGSASSFATLHHLAAGSPSIPCQTADARSRSFTRNTSRACDPRYTGRAHRRRPKSS
jgi:hypothetical protein